MTALVDLHIRVEAGSHEFDPYSDDLYARLGVSRDATECEVLSAYRTAARLTHPDKAGGNGEAFKNVQEAYEVLSNASRRGLYDATNEKGVGALKKQAQKELVTLFGAVVDNMSVEQLKEADVMEVMERQLEGNSKMLKADRTKKKKTIKKLEMVASRLVAKKGAAKNKDGTDILHYALQHRLRGLEGELRELDVKEAVIAAIRSEMEVFEYNHDVPPPTAAYAASKVFGYGLDELASLFDVTSTTAE